MASGLLGLINVEQGPTDEQWHVFHALGKNLLRVDTATLDITQALSPTNLAASLSDPVSRRIFLQLAIMLELCRHPRAEVQLHRLEECAAAIGFEGPQLTAVRDLAHKSAEEATADFLRVYDISMPQLTEVQFKPFANTSQRGSEANWMGSMVNFLIHEVGLFKHAKTLQFVPYGRGGEPYHGLHGSRGALSMEGAPELLAEAFIRGSTCSADFSVIDHLAIAHLPLVDIRKKYRVIPLRHTMRTDDSSELWSKFLE